MRRRGTRGTWTDPALGRTRFDDWLASWWATTTNLRPTTRTRDELVLRLYARPRFGNVPLTAITQLDVRTWVAELSGRGLTPATVNKTYQVFGKVMGAAVDAGYLAQTPCRNVPLPKVEREEMRFLTPAEIIALADAIRPLYRTLCSSARTAACGSVSWRACAEAGSTCCAARSPWPRS
jgi:integrase